MVYRLLEMTGMKEKERTKTIQFIGAKTGPK